MYDIALILLNIYYKYLIIRDFRKIKSEVLITAVASSERNCFLFIYFGHARQLQAPLQWRHRVLTIQPSGSSLLIFFLLDSPVMKTSLL